MGDIHESPAKYRHLSIFDLMELEAYASEQKHNSFQEEPALDEDLMGSDTDKQPRKKHKAESRPVCCSSAEEIEAQEWEASTDANHTAIVGQDILSRLCQQAELAVELGKHLSPRDIVMLYTVSRVFHDTISKYMLSSVRSWVKYKAPEAGRILPFTIYRRYLIADPAGRTWTEEKETDDSRYDSGIRSNAREIPGLRYLQFVVSRDRECREIRAILASNGHRTPAAMHGTLLKLWMLMDIATSNQRACMLRNTHLWSDVDLYNAQMLFVKLGMHFNDPVYGPSSYELLHLMLGQKGLHSLWQLLMGRKFIHLPELLELKMRYDTIVTPEHWTNDYMGEVIHGVHYDDVGTGHLEGWGKGELHLSRPDELIPVEAVARGLELDQHISNMMLWGYIDWATGENLVPTAEELYISDEEEALKNVDTTHHWKRKHVLKKNFDNLPPEQQQAIINQDEDDRLRAMAWCGSDIDDYSSIEDGEDDRNDVYTLDDEIDRGFIVRPQRQGNVPSATDTDGWVDFVNSALRNLTVEVDEDEALRAQAWQSYQNVEFDSDWDWGLWLQQQQQRRQSQQQHLNDPNFDTHDDDSSDDELETVYEEDVDEDDDKQYLDGDTPDEEPAIVDHVVSWT